MRAAENLGRFRMTLSYQERRIYHQHEELDRRIGADHVPAPLRVEPVLADWIED